jgi:hypothetical protein
MSTPKFIRNTTYYEGTVHEWNLPTGSTCPFAKACLVSVDRSTGKFQNRSTEYRCYASSPERFPAVREHRWSNFEHVRSGGIPPIPKDCTAIRIHASGDFFNQTYFDLWLMLAKDHPELEIWAYTKSLRYWVARLDQIPPNLILTASYGGTDDHLIEQYSLKNVKVYPDIDSVPADRPIDVNDHWARVPHVNFALLDNMKVSRKTMK